MNDGSLFSRAHHPAGCNSEHVSWGPAAVAMLSILLSAPHSSIGSLAQPQLMEEELLQNAPAEQNVHGVRCIELTYAAAAHQELAMMMSRVPDLSEQCNTHAHHAKLTLC